VTLRFASVAWLDGCRCGLRPRYISTAWHRTRDNGELLLLAFMAVASNAMAQECVRERAAMVETIRAHARWDTGALPSGISESVLGAVTQTERHRFTADGSLPIGEGQTISQPSVWCPVCFGYIAWVCICALRDSSEATVKTWQTQTPAA
jgi:hypothetical protein